MAKLYALENLFYAMGSFILRVRTISLQDLFKQILAFAEFSDNVDLFSVLEGLIELQQVWMIKLLQTFDLVDDCL